MKYFLMMFLLVWSLPAVANPDLVGVWSWAAFQCRNSDLEANSARSVVWDITGLDVSTAKITLESNNDAGFTYCCNENGDKREETGTWKTLGDQNHVEIGDDQGGFRGKLIDGVLAVYGDKEGATMNNNICNSSEKFVMIFGRVD